MTLKQDIFNFGAKGPEARSHASKRACKIAALQQLVQLGLEVFPKSVDVPFVASCAMLAPFIYKTHVSVLAAGQAYYTVQICLEKINIDLGYLFWYSLMANKNNTAHTYLANIFNKE